MVVTPSADAEKKIIYPYLDLSGQDIDLSTSQVDQVAARTQWRAANMREATARREEEQSQIRKDVAALDVAIDSARTDLTLRMRDVRAIGSQVDDLIEQTTDKLKFWLWVSGIAAAVILIVGAIFLLL